jgi:hypothetical protein
MHRHFCQELCTGPLASRVTVLNGQSLVDSPKEVLPIVAGACGIELDSEQWDSIVDDPSIQRYSKDQRRRYDAESRSQELSELEQCWGSEADAGQEWAVQHGCVNHDVWNPVADPVNSIGDANTHLASAR